MPGVSVTCIKCSGLYINVALCQLAIMRNWMLICSALRSIIKIHEAKNIGLPELLKLKQNNAQCVLLDVQNVSVPVHMQYNFKQA